MAEKNANTWLDTPDPQVFIKNSAKFNDLMMMYRCTVREVRTKLEVLNDEFSLEYKRNPISFIKTRIKKPESIYAKLVRKGLDTDLQTARKKLNDLIGVRIVCLFLDDVYEVAQILKKQQDIKVIKEKDYIEKPKKNGYMSLHLIVDIPIYFNEESETKRVEIQIRTVAMDFWSVLEYQLLYKKNVKGADKVGKELKSYSDEIAALDQKMLKLRNRIESI